MDVDGVNKRRVRPGEEYAACLPTFEAIRHCRRLRVLVAEDSPANQLVAERILRTRGHDVVLAENGREAVQAATHETFDIVLMDIHMPEMDGIEAARRIRQTGRQRSIPIVAFTAYNAGAEGEQCLSNCLSVGMNAYLAKPADWRTLIATLESLCDAA